MKSTENIRVVIYAKARSHSIANEDLQIKREDLNAQLQSCRDVAAKSGWEVVGEYPDFQTGGDNQTPQFDKLLNRATQKGDFEKVLVFTLDRITRKVCDFHALVDLFEQNGVTIQSTRDNYNRLTSFLPLIL